jgi:hypothetical protein
VHGHQQLWLFNAPYDGRCFLPIHLYDTERSRPVAVVLRPGKTPAGVEVRGPSAPSRAVHPTRCQARPSTDRSKLQHPRIALIGKKPDGIWKTDTFLLQRPLIQRGGHYCSRGDPPVSMAIRFSRGSRGSAGVTQGHAGTLRAGAVATATHRAARWFAALSMALGCSGCLPTTDLPDPALDIPPGSRIPMDAPPSLDWWRAFTSGSSSSGLTNGRHEVVNYSASLSASYELDFWGKNRDAAQSAEETAFASRFDRDVVALTTLTGVANAYFHVLASQDRMRVAQGNVASAQRIRDAIKQRFQAGTGTSLDVAQQESVLANRRALVPPLRQILQQNINALATLVSRPPESITIAGGAGEQLRAGTADIVTMLNVQQMLFQAEYVLVQAQLAQLQATVSLYQAPADGWEPRMERPVNAL